MTAAQLSHGIPVDAITKCQTIRRIFQFLPINRTFLAGNKPAIKAMEGFAQRQKQSDAHLGSTEYLISQKAEKFLLQV